MRALVMSGGGAGGAFQVGVLKQLFAAREVFTASYGTSVGALNSAALAFLGFEKMEQIWLQVQESHVLKRNLLSYIGLGSSIYTTDPLREMIEKYIRGTPSMEAVACVVDISNGKKIYSYASRSEISEFKTAVFASASVPFYMPPVNGVLVDGGVREHTPLRQAIRDGYSDITVIACNEIESEDHLGGWRPKGLFKSIQYGLRANDLLQREVFVNDIAAHQDLRIRYFAPKKRIIGTFEFDHELILRAMEQGTTAEAIYEPKCF